MIIRCDKCAYTFTLCPNCQGHLDIEHMKKIQEDLEDWEWVCTKYWTDKRYNKAEFLCLMSNIRKLRLSLFPDSPHFITVERLRERDKYMYGGRNDMPS